ncbi:MAG: FtsX-like permease family protein [Myxococcales bacterium]|nr:FtsX-like permease family protein [Myxococcales bacterium]
MRPRPQPRSSGVTGAPESGVIALFFTVSLPYLRAHAGRILLTLLGVIIGVQGMVAMGALNRSIIASFEAGLEAIAGDARLQIAGAETGIPDTLAEEALRVPGVTSAVAVVDGSLTAASDPSLRIRTFGIDLLGMVGTRSPQFPREHVHIPDELRFVNALDSIALGTPLLERLGVAVGDTVRLATPSGVRSYVVRGTLDDFGPTKLYGGLVALLDLPAAEDVFLSPGLAQTIFIHGDPAVDTDTLATRLRTAIGDRARVERTEARGQQMDALLGSIRIALALASLVTMITAFFIIYETITISIEQRRREIAVTRSLGFTRRAIAGVFVLESLLLGLLGAAGGVAGGYLLARLSLATAVAGVSGMYFTVAPGEVSLPLRETLVAIGLGILVCIAAGIAPALGAAREPVAPVLRSARGARTTTRSPWSPGRGLAAIIAALVVFMADLRLPTAGAKTAWIILGHALFLFGMAFLAPGFVRAASLLAAWVGSRADLTVSLATDFFVRQPRRVAAAASAIMVGYTLVVVLGAVVHSINATLSAWLYRTFGAEISVGTSPGLSSASFDPGLAEDLRRLPGVGSVEIYRKKLFIYGDRPVVIAAFDRANRPDGNPLLLVAAAANAYEDAARGDAVMVSESFAFRYGAGLGAALDLDTPSGRRSFRIVGIARDYTMDVGTILVDIDVYRELWRDARLTYAHVWPAPGADVAALREVVNRAAHDDPNVTVVTNAEFRSEVEARIGDLLRVLGSLQVFACAVAVLGVVNFVLAALLDRRREIAVLRSVGLTASELGRIIMTEGAMVGAVGAGVGLIAGIPASYFMVKHSMLVAMGWSLDFRFPVVLALTTLVAITIAAALAAYFPARHITRGAILAGLEME